MNLPTYLIQLVESSEGLRLEPYQDCCGVWTQGYGTTGSRIKPGQAITPEQAQEWLISDLEAIWQAITARSTIQLETYQTAALADFAYNLGINALFKSTLWQLVQANQPINASLEFSKWVYAGKHIEPGLVIRRHKEALIFLGNLNN
ncbi:lysozyme [Novacetimonas hansenii]|uniref:Lysozyme n=1 Tax=Novacetimonas hansenii TaxID=436 RepID=A0ABQ0SH34_NOVHA|nr:lysozyme [Novacetimonas hansenii]GAN84054.1 lysozyme [Novacetimonas hansenii JCM 7643]GBQ55889.1 phage-related lysozyme [Novacetimonas hansenii NRIC 0243]GEC64579.1 lysozyme [Novacetimonas hansenii]